MARIRNQSRVSFVILYVGLIRATTAQAASVTHER